MTDITPKEEAPRCERCGSEMEWQPASFYEDQGQQLCDEAGDYYFCPLPESACQSIAALRSEVEALRKRNEELGQELGDEKIEKIRLLNVATESRRDMFHAQEKHDQLLRASGVLGESHLELLARKDKILADLSAAESRAQEAETKLRDAEDAVVVLREALWKLGEHHEGCAAHDPRRAISCDCVIQAILANTATLAAQRKREIQREALEEACDRVIKCGPLSAQTPEGVLKAILNPEGPDANTENK